MNRAREGADAGGCRVMRLLFRHALDGGTCFLLLMAG